MREEGLPASHILPVAPSLSYHLKECLMVTLLASLISALITAAIVAPYPSTVEVVEAVLPSMAYLEMPGRGNCTAFSIAPERFLTASHCVTGQVVLIDTHLAAEINVDYENDLALVTVPAYSLPPLKVAGGVKLGEEVMSFGYGNGPLRVGVHIISSLLDTVVVTWDGYIPGMSGGPVVNMKGEVVSMVQKNVPTRNRPDAHILGAGPTPEIIKEFLRALEF